MRDIVIRKVYFTVKFWMINSQSRTLKFQCKMIFALHRNSTFVEQNAPVTILVYYKMKFIFFFDFDVNRHEINSTLNVCSWDATPKDMNNTDIFFWMLPRNEFHLALRFYKRKITHSTECRR